MGAWAGASAPEHQGRWGHCLAPRGGPRGGQGQALAGRNNDLCLRFDLFSVASSRVKKICLKQADPSLFSVTFKLPEL